MGRMICYLSRSVWPCFHFKALFVFGVVCFRLVCFCCCFCFCQTHFTYLWTKIFNKTKNIMIRGIIVCMASKCRKLFVFFFVFFCFLFFSKSLEDAPLLLTDLPELQNVMFSLCILIDWCSCSFRQLTLLTRSTSSINAFGVMNQVAEQVDLDLSTSSFNFL